MAKDKKIRILKEKKVYNGRFIEVINRPFIGIQGKNGIWETVRRKTHGHIVAVVPVTGKKEVILTKTYRIPLKSYVIEFSAGIADKIGESEKGLARRELLEETGYTVKRLIPIMRGPFNSGLVTDEMVVFLGTEARKIQEPRLENGEDIEVIKIPITKLFRFLKNPPRGTKVDIKTFGALYFLKDSFLED